MDAQVSKALKKATENLQAKMLASQQIEAELMKLKTAFVKETDPVKKEKYKTLLIAKNKQHKAAEAEVEQADAYFHKALSMEPEDVYDLLDHKIQEHIVRSHVRKLVKESFKDLKTKKTLKEEEDKTPMSLQDEVEKWFSSNKKKLEKLADEDNWDDFYDLGFEKFEDADQDDVAQAMNKAAMKEGMFIEVEESEMPDEKELTDMVFGEKSQQKGVNTSDYDKKMKMPKASSTELYIESKKKMK